MRMVDYVSWLSVLSVTQIDWVNITKFIQPEDGGGGEAVAGVVGPFEEKKVYKGFFWNHISIVIDKKYSNTN